MYVEKNGKTKRAQVVMHRLISNALDGEVIDHINRNKLDNRRCNLRRCTHQQNSANRGPMNPESGYKGVHWNKSAIRYAVKIHKHDKCYLIGHYIDKHEAAKAYNKANKEINGEFAFQNEITKKR